MQNQNEEGAPWGSLEKVEFFRDLPRIRRFLQEEKRNQWTIVIGGGGNKTDRVIAAILLRRFGSLLCPTARWNIEWAEELRAEMSQKPLWNYLREGIIPLGVHQSGVFGRRSGTDISLTQKIILLLPNEAKAERTVYWPIGQLMTEVLLSRPHSKGEPQFWQLTDYWDRINIPIETQIQRMEEIILGWIKRQEDFVSHKKELEKFSVKVITRNGKQVKIASGFTENTRIASQILRGTTKLGLIDIIVVENPGRLAVLTRRNISLREAAMVLRTKIQPADFEKFKQLLNRSGGGPLLGVDYEISSDGNERLVMDRSFFEDPKKSKWIGYQDVTKIVSDTLQLKSSNSS